MTDAEKNALLEEALEQYGLSGAKCELIRHNENLTYRVNGQYLLRVHAHREGFTTGVLYEGLDRAKLRAEELRLLARLQSRGMRVQTPVKNARGETVSRLSGGVLATLLTWLDGRKLEKDDVTRARAREIGEMIAHMHACARDFQAEPALRYDAGLCARLSASLRADAGMVDEGAAEALLAALEAIGEYLSGREGEFIPVHSDLSLSNMILSPDGISPIDFSLFGMCVPMMDLGAVCCSIMSDDCRLCAAEGYAAAGGQVNLRGLDCAFALNVLLGIVLHLPMWSRESWFPERLKTWRADIFEPLVAGERVALYGGAQKA